MTHPAEDGFHEIQLTGKQLVFLFMATTVVAVVIFLLGVLVGRNVRNDQAAAAEAPATLETSRGESLGAPPPPSAQGGESGGPTTEDLSYAQRLQGEDPKEQLKGGSASTTPEPPTPAEPEPQRESPPPAPSASASEEAKAPVATRPEPVGWVVQVAALRDRAAAVAIVQRLSRKGYEAFIVEPSRGAPAPGYRVRVGPFQDRRQAEQASRRLEREEQFKPFITR